VLMEGAGQRVSKKGNKRNHAFLSASIGFALIAFPGY